MTGTFPGAQRLARFDISKNPTHIEKIESKTL